MTKEFTGIIEAALMLAYEAGKWEGQVELEEHIERNSYYHAFLGHLYSQKTGGGVAHSVSTDKELLTKPVKYNLRSNEWREGVRKSAKEYVGKALEFVKMNAGSNAV